MQTRYHIQYSKRRTSIMLDTILSDMLAIKLGVDPDSPEAHATVRVWLEQTIIDKLGDNLPSGSRVSQWARYHAIQALVSTKISAAYVDVQSKRQSQV